MQAADLRFGQPPNLRFVVTVVLDRELKVLAENFEYGMVVRQ